ncbi:MAG TPA: ABC transporter permease [Halanaerobiales bacterium]|nr:ABC transporter permease [Halanaerobiales bacterium]
MNKYIYIKKKIKWVYERMIGDYRFYIAGVIIFLFFLMAIFGPQIAPHDPYKTDVRSRLEAPSLTHPAGTDSLGRDTLSRLIYAARPAFYVAFGGLFISIIVGMILGSIAAYSGGILDNIIIFLFDVIRAFPPIILILVLVAIVGPSLQSLIIILGVTIMPRYGRVVRAETLSVKEEEYVSVAKSMGASSFKIISFHIIPNIFASVLVLAGMDVASMIMWEAGLSFLGLGVQPPKTSWGVMLQSGYQYIEKAPMMLVAPAVAIMLTMMGFSLLTESLRNALNPKSEQKEG